MRYTTRPLVDRSWVSPRARVQSRFDSTWTSTLELLERELTALRAKEVVLEVDVPDRGVRLDGQLRADARANSPAVVLSFESKHGALMYRCDRFVAPSYRRRMEDWQHNVRAIALTLESLRAVDRYGATQTGQQYTGWAAIGATAHAAPTDPMGVLHELAGVRASDGIGGDRVISLARRAAHPDTGGSPEAWARFTAAYKAVRP